VELILKKRGFEIIYCQKKLNLKQQIQLMGAKGKILVSLMEAALTNMLLPYSKHQGLERANLDDSTRHNVTSILACCAWLTLLLHAKYS